MAYAKRLQLALSLLLIGMLMIACVPAPPSADGDAAGQEAATEEEATESTGETLDEITVAYFLEWPTPNMAALADGTYDEVLGLKVNWVPFDTGTAMSAAMTSGDVHMAYSQGLVPFANGVTVGLPLKMVGVAVTYADNDNCVVATSAGITAENAAELNGQKVAVPIGTVAHYKMLRSMEHLGVDITTLELVDLAPSDGAAALQRGDVTMACGWAAALQRMLENGNILMTGAEQEAIGIKVFDIISATDDFATNHPDLVTAFLQVTEDANRAYAEDPTANIQAMADAAGLDLETANSVRAVTGYPDKDAQISEEWMGGGVQAFVKEVADFFVEQGEIESALDSYDEFIDTSFLEQVN